MSAPGNAPDHGPDHGTVDGTVDVEAEEAHIRGLRGQSRRRAQRALITDAIRSPEQNRRSREKRYLLLQGVRLPLIVLCLVAAFVWQNWVLAAIFFTVSVPLPWISVMVANGDGEVREKRERNVYKPAVARAQLEAERQAQLGPAGGGTPGNAPTIIDHENQDAPAAG